MENNCYEGENMIYSRHKLGLSCAKLSINFEKGLNVRNTRIPSLWLSPIDKIDILC